MRKIAIIVIVFMIVAVGFLSGCNSKNKSENTYSSKDKLDGSYLDEINDVWNFSNGDLKISRSASPKQDLFYDIFNINGTEILVIFDYYDLSDFANISYPYYNFYRDVNFTMIWIDDKTLQLKEVDPLIIDRPIMLVLRKQ